ncbi:MAG: hypothetical protein J6Y60_02250 [Treponema sp.]|nr:hypothetical protein [Treponema sp.]
MINILRGIDAKIRIKNCGPIASGFDSDDGFIDFGKYTLFIGDQGTGKSTVVKLISLFSWLEKALFRGDYEEEVKTVREFGIRDDEEGKEQDKAPFLANNPSNPIAEIPAKEFPAFWDYENKKDWNAIVLSEERNDFKFIPVDNKVPNIDPKGNEKSRCDAMIYTAKTVVFIELKNQMQDWFDDAVEQLKSTIEYFDDVDGLARFRFRKAYVCNKKHPYFNYHYKERMQKFYRETGVTLRPEMVIKDIK